MSFKHLAVRGVYKTYIIECGIVSESESFKHLAVRGVCKTAGFSLFFDPRVLIFVIFEVIFTKLSQFKTAPRKSQSPCDVSLLYHIFMYL